jgi:sentrin-specific protease 1
MSVSRFLTTGKVNHFLADEEKNDVLLIDDSDEVTGEADSDLYMDGEKWVDKKEDLSDMPDMRTIANDIKRNMPLYKDMVFKLDTDGIPRISKLGRDFNDNEKDRLAKHFEKAAKYECIRKTCEIGFPWPSELINPPSGLSPLAQKACNILLQQIHFRDIKKKKERFSIKYENFRTLLPSVWLDDTVIDIFFKLITERSHDADFKNSNPLARNVWSFSSFFYGKLKIHEDIRRWTKNIDIFSCDLILIPLNLNKSHWALGAINFQMKRFQYFDSLGDSSKDFFRLIRIYMENEHFEKKKSPFNFEGWQNRQEPCPKQTNNCDCGEFVCRFAEYLSRGKTLRSDTFNTYDMTYFRRRHALEILNNKLF